MEVIAPKLNNMRIIAGESTVMIQPHINTIDLIWTIHCLGVKSNNEPTLACETEQGIEIRIPICQAALNAIRHQTSEIAIDSLVASELAGQYSTSRGHTKHAA